MLSQYHERQFVENSLSAGEEELKGPFNGYRDCLIFSSICRIIYNSPEG